MGRRRLNDRRILLTGASGGIGRELALQLAPYGTKLYLVARSAGPLAELAQQLKQLGAASAEPVVGDVTDPNLRGRLVEQIRNEYGALDLLINNAGISAHGRFEQSSPEVMRQIMEVNFFAAVELARECLPLLKSGDDPLLVNVGSILGHRGLPFNNEYCASKAALVGWSEAIRPELKRSGVNLLMISPGTTDTEFFDHLIATGEQLPWGKQQGIAAQKVASLIIRAIRSRRYEIFPNWRGRLLVLLNRLSPALVDRFMNRYG